MNGFQYYTQSAKDAETAMIIAWVLVVLFVVLSLCVMFSIISMSNSLSDIRNILREHLTIGQLSEGKKAEETEQEKTEE